MNQIETQAGEQIRAAKSAVHGHQGLGQAVAAAYEPPSPVQGYEQQEYPQYEQPQAAYPEIPPQQQ